ncbi:SRPBCC domain-containing protein [Paenibacillus sp. IB182496]|uniref:SRPBCC domain-containing protein n=1 Tax=Paenibacillus sabuli TaxID=2772509 RepID=A0A927GRH5_9BACL|nr:SRPBCC domain-containing protein [Paenibacillus sabuli]MBD2844980.1 SRPBCC domain-containing protein [Paenibacillus sabuli]
MDIIGNEFRTAVKRETGKSWAEWTALLDADCAPDGGYDEAAAYLAEVHGLDDRWVTILAGTNEHRQGRKPVGLTAAVGYQIGVRRTVRRPKLEVWDTLVSPSGLRLWLGEMSELQLQAGARFVTKEGNVGTLRIVKPPDKLRMAWQMPGWDKPSTLQLQLLASGEARTTVSYHQEKLTDLYMRETMRRRWETALDELQALCD